VGGVGGLDDEDEWGDKKKKKKRAVNFERMKAWGPRICPLLTLFARSVTPTSVSARARGLI